MGWVILSIGIGLNSACTCCTVKFILIVALRVVVEVEKRGNWL